MCITSGPAELSGTKILSFPIGNGRHMLSYANTVGEFFSFSHLIPSSSNPNCMILPIPGEVKEEWFYDTSEYSGFLKDIEKHYEKKMKSKSRGMTLSFNSNSVSVFENGMYTVVTSKSVDAIKGAIQTLPEDKRPVIKDELLDFFEKHYNGWSFVICCFSAGNKMDSQPITFEYEPLNKGFLFFPAVDCHTGDAPFLDSHVGVDHCIIHGSAQPYAGVVRFKEETPVVFDREYDVSTFKTQLENGDWWIGLDDGKLKRLRPEKSPV